MGSIDLFIYKYYSIKKCWICFEVPFSLKGDTGWQIVYKNQELVWARHLAWVPLGLTAECLCRHGRAAQGLRKHQRKTMLYNPVRDSLHISNLNAPFKTLCQLGDGGSLALASQWLCGSNTQILLFQSSQLKKKKELIRGYLIPCLRSGFLSLGTIDVWGLDAS